MQFPAPVPFNFLFHRCCHVSTALSSSPRNVVLPLLCRCSLALSSSPCAVFVSLLSPCPVTPPPTPPVCDRPPPLSQSPCSLIVLLRCHSNHLLSQCTCSAVFPNLTLSSRRCTVCSVFALFPCSKEESQPKSSSACLHVISLTAELSP